MPGPQRIVLGVGPSWDDATRLKVHAFNAGSDSVFPIDADLPYLVVYNADGSSHTLTAEPRAVRAVGEVNVPFLVPTGGVINVPTALFHKINDGSANGNVYCFYSDVPIATPPTMGQSANPNIVGGSNGQAFAQSSSNILFIGQQVSTGAGVFPIDVALDSVAETIFTCAASQQLVLLGVHQPPSAALAGNIEIWEQAAETNLVLQIALGTTDAELLARPAAIQMGPGNIFEVNVTGGGAAGTRLRISAYQVA